MCAVGSVTDEHVGQLFENGPAGHQRHVASLHHQLTQLAAGRRLVDGHVMTGAVGQEVHLDRRLRAPTNTRTHADNRLLGLYLSTEKSFIWLN